MRLSMQYIVCPLCTTVRILNIVDSKSSRALVKMQCKVQRIMTMRWKIGKERAYTHIKMKIKIKQRNNMLSCIPYDTKTLDNTTDNNDARLKAHARSYNTHTNTCEEEERVREFGEKCECWCFWKKEQKRNESMIKDTRTCRMRALRKREIVKWFNVYSAYQTFVFQQSRLSNGIPPDTIWKYLKIASRNAYEICGSEAIAFMSLSFHSHPHPHAHSYWAPRTRWGIVEQERIAANEEMKKNRMKLKRENGNWQTTAEKNPFV